jgi:diguanylate cyclase (GGDEF)-like protein
MRLQPGVPEHKNDATHFFDRRPADWMAGMRLAGDSFAPAMAAPRPNSVLDPAFSAELAPEKLWNARVACVIAAVLYSLFGIIDLWMIPSALHLVWAIRAVVVIITLVALLLTRHEQFLLNYEKFALFMPALWAAGIEAMLYLAAPGDPARHSYYAGLILVVIGYHSWFYLPITAMAVITVAIVAIYAVIALVVHDVASTGGLPTLVSNLFFLGSAVVICVAVQVRRYRYLLEIFQWRRALARDLADKEDAHRRSEHQATHDVLTGLPNRAHFVRLADRAIEAAQKQGSWVAVMFIDLDGFKPINDTHGHAVGDEVLKILAQRMRNCLKGSDTIGRLGGDEFGAVVALPAGAFESAEKVAGKMLGALSQPIALGALRLVITASFGVSLFPCHGTVAQTLLSIADRCMYQAKGRGKAGVRLARVDAATR